QKDLDEEKARLRLIEEEKARDEYKRLIDQKRELELLFGQAQMYFEREQYRHCIEICDKILYINTNLTSVAEMRNVAQRLQHMKLSRENLKNYVEEGKRTFEQIELHSAVQADELEFPDMATWKELIAKRQPKGLAAGEEAKQQFTGEDLANLIKNTIHKDQWEEADGKSVQFQNGLLIVRNSIEMHKSIRKFLSDLRASTSMLVSVETRFLSVESDFLQQVGMDFRDVSAAGNQVNRVQGISVLTDINPSFVLPQHAVFLP